MDVRDLTRAELLKVPMREDRGLFTSLVLVWLRKGRYHVIGVRLMRPVAALGTLYADLPRLDAATDLIESLGADVAHVFPRSTPFRTGLFRVDERDGRLRVTTDQLPTATVAELWDLRRAHVH